MRIASVSENRNIEKRIAITPDIAKKYIALELEVSLTENYGEHLGFKDNDYKELGVEIFKKDADYIVRDGKVQIFDEFTGRVLGGRRFSDGLHQALEAKENVNIEEENQTLASITFQNYFRLYKKLSGMTGTAITEAEEFFDIYNLNVVSVPTNKKMLRKDLND